MIVKDTKAGIVYALLSYIMWGLTPVYWKLTQSIAADEILAQRMVWSFVFMALLLVANRQGRAFLTAVRMIFKQPALLGRVFLAAVLISLNWGIFMWAVIEGRILEASLGQYINPLTSMLLGVIFLKEKLSVRQTFSFVLAGLGVLVLAFHLGFFPWVSLSLALTFGFYSLSKKIVQVDASVGLAIETMLVLPLALAYVGFLAFHSQLQFTADYKTAFLLAGSGAVTALPLLLFSKSAKTVSLSMLGILQYISPTLSLLVGVILYHEPVSAAHALAFLLIWSGLGLYTISAQARS